MATRKKREPARRPAFDEQRFLDSTGAAERITYERSAVVFSQGDPAVSVMYIQQGSVKLSVVSATGKEAVVAVLMPGDFFGEGCVAGQPLRMATATAVTTTHGSDRGQAHDAPDAPRTGRVLRPVDCAHGGTQHPHRG